MFQFFFFVNYKLNSSIYINGRLFIERWLSKKLNSSLRKQYNLNFSYQKLKFDKLNQFKFKSVKLYNKRGKFHFNELNISFDFHQWKLIFLIQGKNIFVSWDSLKFFIANFKSQNKNTKKSYYYSIKFKFINVTTKIRRNKITADISFYNNIVTFNISTKTPIKFKILATIDLLQQKILLDMENEEDSLKQFFYKIKLKSPIYYSQKKGQFKINHKLNEKNIIPLLILKKSKKKKIWEKNYSLDSLFFSYDKKNIQYSGKVISKLSLFEIHGKYSNKDSKNKASVKIKNFKTKNYNIKNITFNFKNKLIHSTQGKFFFNLQKKRIEFTGKLNGNLKEKKFKIQLVTQNKIDINSLLVFNKKNQIQQKNNYFSSSEFSLNLKVKEMFYKSKNLNIYLLKNNEIRLEKKKKLNFFMSSQLNNKNIKIQKIAKNLFYFTIKDVEVKDLVKIFPKIDFNNLGKMRGKFTVHATNVFSGQKFKSDFYIYNQKKIVVENSSIQKKIWTLPIFKNKSFRYDSFEKVKIYLNYQNKNVTIENLQLKNQHYLIDLKDYSFKKKNPLKIDFFFNQFFYDQYLSTGISANIMGSILKNKQKNKNQFQYFYRKIFQ